MHGQSAPWFPVQHTGPVGKRGYVAPEVIGGESSSYDGPQCDVWTLGVSLFMLVFGEVFKGKKKKPRVEATNGDTTPVEAKKDQ